MSMSMRMKRTRTSWRRRLDDAPQQLHNKDQEKKAGKHARSNQVHENLRLTRALSSSTLSVTRRSRSKRITRW